MTQPTDQNPSTSTFARKSIHEVCDCNAQKSSLAMIVRSLIVSDCTFTVDDLMRYTILIVGAFALMLIIFPTQILFILLLLVFIVVCLARLMLVSVKKLESSYTDKPIDINKLRSLRAELQKQHTSTKND